MADICGGISVINPGEVEYVYTIPQIPVVHYIQNNIQAKYTIPAKQTVSTIQYFPVFDYVYAPYVDAGAAKILYVDDKPFFIDLISGGNVLAPWNGDFISAGSVFDRYCQVWWGGMLSGAVQPTPTPSAHARVVHPTPSPTPTMSPTPTVTQSVTMSPRPIVSMTPSVTASITHQ